MTIGRSGSASMSARSSTRRWGLLATGGSTNHAIHLPAIARAAGILFDWEDLDRLSAAVPMIARVYPNGSGDVNQFEAAGGMAFTIRTLLDAGLLHGDILTVAGEDLGDYARRPALAEDRLIWEDVPASLDETMLRSAATPFAPDGGMRLVQGNLGRATFKTSAVDPSRWTIEAPARIFSDQDACWPRSRPASSSATWSSWSASRDRAPTACPNSTSSPRRSAVCRTAGSGSPSSPTAACRGRPERCRRRSM
jgi:hypothetical protein